RSRALAAQPHARLEQRLVVGRMVEQLLRLDPAYQAILEGPIGADEMSEWRAISDIEARDGGTAGGESRRRAFREEFDRSLGGRTSLLVDWPSRNEETLAQSVREVLGLPRARMSDDDAI